ncbi:MAG: type IV pili methyl-accepting chemotaxis transducer N-terminal domain-containing protein, partial [Gammaproteobacteria bacterium]|nr:type IV pili methyl-accepting chemotaxis transducer N-terminal domain-containing protein [Gammaproteobacteria bacterium]
MKIALHEIDLKTLKRDITLDFSLLLSSFLILLSIAYIFSYNAIAEKEYDSVLLNIAGRQRMLLRQYASEVNQTLVGLATLDLKMAISKKTKVNQTLKLFEKTHKAFVHGGEIITDINGKNTIIIPPQKNREILLHLKHVDEKWQELKRISLLSLRTNTESITHNAYIYQLLDQTNATVFEMDHVVQVMQHDSETRLRQLDHILLTMVAIGFILFFILVY